MQVQLIDVDQVVVQSKGYIASDMDGDKVMLSVDLGKYYNLGSIGGRIWDMIETPTSIQVLISTLTTEYDIDQETCKMQVLTFLQSMITERLIQIEGRN